MRFEDFCDIAFVALLFWFAISCTPAYPKCAPADATKFRCNGDTVEMCDGQTWSPRIDCKEQWNDHGELVPQECVQSGNDAECE